MNASMKLTKTKRKHQDPVSHVERKEIEKKIVVAKAHYIKLSKTMKH